LKIRGKGKRGVPPPEKGVGWRSGDPHMIWKKTMRAKGKKRFQKKETEWNDAEKTINFPVETGNRAARLKKEGGENWLVGS